MIFDTDVLIWYIRHNAQALEMIASAQDRHISQATWLELVNGVRNKRELSVLKTILTDFNFKTIHFTEFISQKAGMLMEEHALKDGLSSLDSIIAATALVCNLPLVTANYKHFKSLGLDLRILKP